MIRVQLRDTINYFKLDSRVWLENFLKSCNIDNKVIYYLSTTHPLLLQIYNPNTFAFE